MFQMFVSCLNLGCNFFLINIEGIVVCSLWPTKAVVQLKLSLEVALHLYLHQVLRLLSPEINSHELF